MSPFLTYAEVMPSKPSKDLCQKSLINFLKYLTQNEIVVDNNNGNKRQKVDSKGSQKI